MRQKMLQFAFAIFFVTILTLPAQATNAFERLHNVLHSKKPAAAPSQTPLIVTSVPHFSHLEKVGAVALELASMGYPIRFLTGRVFEKLISSLHPNIEFVPLLGPDDLMTEEDMKALMSLPPKERELFATKTAFVDRMKDSHNSMQLEAAMFRQKYGDTKPMIVLFDMALTGHYPVMLGAPGIRPDANIAISTGSLILDSNDTFPFRTGKAPDTSANARAIHWAAYQEYYESPYIKELNKYWKAKLRELGAVKEPFPGIFHALNAVSDYLVTQGIPEFEFPRSDIRKDIRYFGALKNLKKTDGQANEVPAWWDDIQKAKAEGKKLVAVSQGTVETDPQELILPTLSALKDREDVLVIATFVAFEPSEVSELEVPENARVAKFVPHDLLLPFVDVFISNGGFGAIQHALQVGVPLIIAGESQEKANNGALVEWSGVGINLRTRRPGVEQLGEAVKSILGDSSYKQKAMNLSKNFERYSVGQVFDEVIQETVLAWEEKRKKAKVNDGKDEL